MHQRNVQCHFSLSISAHSASYLPTVKPNMEKMPMTCQSLSPQKTTVSELTGSGFFGGSVGRSWGVRGTGRGSFMRAVSWWGTLQTGSRPRVSLRMGAFKIFLEGSWLSMLPMAWGYERPAGIFFYVTLNKSLIVVFLLSPKSLYLNLYYRRLRLQHTHIPRETFTHTRTRTHTHAHAHTTHTHRRMYWQKI